MPIYKVETPDGKILKIEGPEGASEDQLLGFAASQYYAQQEQETAPVVAQEAPKGRTWGEAGTDIGASLLSGVGSLAQMPGQIGTLAGLYKPEEAAAGLQGMGKQLEEYGQSLKSQELKAKEAARAQKVSKAEGVVDEFVTAIKETALDPALMTSFFAEQVPNLIGSMGAGLLTKAGLKVALRGATEQVLDKAAVRGMVGTNAAMQGADVGADTYEELYARLTKDGMDPAKASEIALDKARMAAVESAAVSIGTTMLPGGTTIERALVGRGLPRTGGILKGVAGEAVQEGLEEGGGKLASNIQQAELYPETDIFKGVGEAAGMGALMGGAFGGIGGATLRGGVQAPMEPTGVEPAPTTPSPIEPEGDDAARIRKKEEEEEARLGIAPVEPTVEPTPVEPTVEPSPVEPTPVEPAPVEPTEPQAPKASPMFPADLAKSFMNDKGEIDYKAFGNALGETVYNIIKEGAVVTAYVNGKPHRIIRNDGEYLVDDQGVKISPVNFGGFAEDQTNRMEYTLPSEPVMPTEPEAPVEPTEPGEPVSPEPIEPVEPVEPPPHPELPVGMHPVEAEGFAGAEEVKREALDNAAKAGIKYEFDDNGKINPRHSTIDWDLVGKAGTGKRLLELMYSHTPSDYQEIIKRIMPHVANVPVRIDRKKSTANKGQNGVYFGGTNHVEYTFHSPVGNSFDVILHELVHAATVNNYSRGRSGMEPQYTAAAKEMDKLAKFISENYSSQTNALWFLDRNVGYTKSLWGMELIARGMTNREVQEALKKIKISGKTTGFTKFVSTVRKLLGLAPKDESALTKLIDLSEQLMAPQKGARRKRVATAEPIEIAETAPVEQPTEEPRPGQHRTIFGEQTPKAEWGITEPAGRRPWSLFSDNLVYDFLDRFVDLKRVIQAINKTEKKLDEVWDAYRRETLYHNRVAYQTKQFLKNELKPLAQSMAAKGVSEEELNNYLLARYAEERNNAINQRNDSPELQNRGSGVHTLIARAYLSGVNAQQAQQIRDVMKQNGMELNNNETKLLEDAVKMTDAKRNGMKDLAKRVDEMVRRTQDISVNGGLERQATINYWRDMYPNYVPLKRNPDEMDFVEKNYGAGQGFSTRAGFGKAATGSLKTVDNILANIVLQRDMSIVRSEKARIGRALYAMALSHPNPKFWLPVNPNASVISKANDLYVQIQKNIARWEEVAKRIENDQVNGVDPSQQDIEEAAALSRKINYDKARHADLAAQAERVKKQMVNELNKLEPNHGLTPEAIENMIREPEGAWYNPATKRVEYRTNAYLRASKNVLAIPIDGETRYIFFNPGDERAKRLVTALKDGDLPQLGEITSAVSKATRWIASVNTQYNPFFGIINMMRDIQGAQFNLSSTPLAGEQGNVTSRVPKAVSTIYQSLRAEREGGKATGPYAEAWEEFQRLGGPTGLKDMLARQNDKVSVLAEEIQKMQESGAKKLGRRGVDATFGWLSDFNDTMENAVRLSAFIEGKRKFMAKGMDETVAAEKAAELAKNLTVNFNRKGQKTQLINSWFAFFNAAAQGSARLYETLSGPAGKKIMLSMVMMGVLQQLALTAAGFDDEDPPEFVREKNIVIPTGDGGYLSWPMPLGFNFFVNFGRIVTAGVQNGGENPSKYVLDLASVFSNTFNPLGSSGLSMQTVAPTIADPLLAIEANRDAFGRPIYREDQATRPTPAPTRTSERATNVSRFISEVLNRVSGGTEYQKGKIDVTGDEIDYLAGQVGGGVWREGKKIADFVSDQIQDTDTAPYKIPFVGRFVGDTKAQANIKTRFYQNVITLANYENEIKGRAKDGKSVEEFMKEHPEARFYGAINTIENEISKINKMRKALVERGASKQELEHIDALKYDMMNQFNQTFEKARK